MKPQKNIYHGFLKSGLLFTITLILLAFNGFSINRDIVEVPDLGTLRETGLTDGTVYKVTGEIVLTHQNGNRNQKYFQDDSGAILVDDAEGIITSSYEKYDGITDLTGTLSVFFEMLQFIPIEDPGPAVSSGNIIEPLTITLLDLTPDHQAMLVSLQSVSFESPQHLFFQPSTSYTIEDPSGQGILRTPNINADLDYFGAPIPDDAIDMVVIVSQFDEDMQVFPRSLADMDYDPDTDPDVVDVDDIAAFKSQDPGSPIVYRITGEVFITHLQLPYRGQFYIQDDSGAILIDDPQGVIETEYSLYDGITGIKGQLTQFQNMLQLLPDEDPGEASSHDNQIEPVELTLADLTEDIQGLLVLIRNVTFDEDNPEVWTHNQSYVIYDDSGEGLIRTPNFPDLLDYFGDPVPDTPKDIIGVLHQRFAVTRLLPRMSADFMDPDDYELIPGDANCDGVVNVLDIITIANYFIGLDPDPFCFENADVNGDGVINVLDLIGVAEIFSGDN